VRVRGPSLARTHTHTHTRAYTRRSAKKTATHAGAIPHPHTSHTSHTHQSRYFLRPLHLCGNCLIANTACGLRLCSFCDACDSLSLLRIELGRGAGGRTLCSRAGGPASLAPASLNSGDTTSLISVWALNLQNGS